MLRIFIIISVALTTLTSCEGWLQVTGTVYKTDNGIRKPLDNTKVKVYCGKDWLRGTVQTDTSGQYALHTLTTPQKATYYIIFEDPAYKTDTVKVRGTRGKTIISLDHEMKK